MYKITDTSIALISFVTVQEAGTNVRGSPAMAVNVLNVGPLTVDAGSWEYDPMGAYKRMERERVVFFFHRKFHLAS